MSAMKARIAALGIACGLLATPPATAATPEQLLPLLWHALPPGPLDDGADPVDAKEKIVSRMPGRSAWSMEVSYAGTFYRARITASEDPVLADALLAHVAQEQAAMDRSSVSRLYETRYIRILGRYDAAVRTPVSPGGLEQQVFVPVPGADGRKRFVFTLSLEAAQHVGPARFEQWSAAVLARLPFAEAAALPP